MELKRDDIIKALDILERFDFFQGQRAGRELWNEKPFDVQEQDIAKFSQDVAWLKNYIKELTEEVEQRIEDYQESQRKWEKAYDKLEYTLEGVMHSVDKWLDGAELEQDEVNRAATMREKTLKIVENLIEQNEQLTSAVNFTDDVTRVKTVRKMQERLKEAPIKVGLPLFGLQTKDEIEDYANGLILQMRDAIDQIAKEMLEGKDGNR